MRISPPAPSARRSRRPGSTRGSTGSSSRRAPRSSIQPHEVAWRTLVFSARTEDTHLAPQDVDEIAGARWGTAEELSGELRTALLATGHALWRYRVALHDAALAALGV